MAPRVELAVGAIVRHAGALLLIERAQPPGEGLWSLPGGRVEPGESVTDAVEREVSEETGLVVQCGELVGHAERMSADHHFFILDFAAELRGPSKIVAATDARQGRWVPLEDVISEPLVDGLREFLLTHGIV